MYIKRCGYIYITIIALLCALIIRVLYISFGFINAEVKSVAGSRTAEIVLYNSKGTIYDRNLNALSGNQECDYLVISPRELDKTKVGYLARVTKTPEDVILNKITKENIFVLKTFEQPETIKGVYAFKGTARYPEHPVCQHIIGYLDSDDVVGLSGVEKAFNDELSLFLKKIKLKYTADATRGIIGGLSFSDDNVQENKNGVVLTIDKKLSEISEEVMKKYTTEGAVIIMNANTGEVLTLSSFPSFNAENVSSYFTSISGELINNALTNQTVGSVFKIIVAASAIINNFDTFTFDCKGGIQIGDKTIICQNNKVHGIQTLEDAFANSCNSYFVALGQLLGYEKIIDTAELFGADSSLQLCKNINSAQGLLPENNGNLSVANLSIGQGELMLSPLCIARITAAVCNGGFLVNPQLYKSFYIDGEYTCLSEYNYKAQILNSDVAEKLRKICVQCVEIGTGNNAMPKFNGAGGKTASAQTGKYLNKKEVLNTYFTGFYPAENPEYVITVFAKNGKSGSQTCAPVFKEICDFISENY